jgi:type VI secretion system protein ImpF
MAGAARVEILRPSILDRLSEPPGKGEGHFTGIGVRDLKRAVARDLAWLLNTRVWVDWDFEGMDEAAASILNYGIPELSSYSWARAEDGRTIARAIEKVIRTFEPRLIPRSIKCELVPSDDISDFSMRVRIEAVLHVEPISEPIAFDAGFGIEGGGLRIESFE